MKSFDEGLSRYPARYLRVYKFKSCQGCGFKLKGLGLDFRVHGLSFQGCIIQGCSRVSSNAAKRGFSRLEPGRLLTVDSQLEINRRRNARLLSGPNHETLDLSVVVGRWQRFIPKPDLLDKPSSSPSQHTLILQRSESEYISASTAEVRRFLRT